MNKFYLKLSNIQNKSNTKIDLSNVKENVSLWDSSFNPTFGNDIVSKPLVDHKHIL
ncbi:hypothetical protein SDC9_78412 [bioreactor metagenome]|uniref:Uncharacterized protein n=1 Tax=bioreactor metagenome TaxID=1076179 RepID=A0A644YTF4_9ZZZZ